MFCVMEHSKEFYESVIRVIEHIAEGNTSVSCDKGNELAGNYWPAVVDWFKDEKAVTVMTGGDIWLTQKHRLNPILEDCRNIIKNIRKSENDRLLDNTGKWIAIVCGVGGFLISLLSIYLSFMAYTRPSTSLMQSQQETQEEICPRRQTSIYKPLCQVSIVHYR